MEVSLDIYNWLKEIKIISEDPETQENGRCKLPEETSQSLENGLNFAVLIKRLYKLQNKLDRETTPMPEMNTLKEVKSPAAKLYNWKILISALDLLEIKIDSDSRSLIVAGDREIVSEVLCKIYESEKKALQRSDPESLDQSSITSKALNDSVDKSPASSAKRTPVRKSKNSLEKAIPKTKKKPDGSLYIESIRPEKPLATCETCLEFLLASFCKHFSLRPKQAAGLLTQGGKYLAYIICKGLKGKHTPIIDWYSELYACTPTLLKLILQEEASGSVPFMLASLKSGFESKNLETVLWSCRIFSKLGSDLFEEDLLPPAWDWFVSESGGLESCLQACRRFGGQVKLQIVSVLVQFARGNFLELFTIQMRNAMPDRIVYLTTMDEFLAGFYEIRTAKQEIISGGIVDYWLESCMKESDPEVSNDVDIRLSAINFMCNIWILFPNVIENHEVFANEILGALKKAWRDRYQILKLSCISKAFQMLDVFTQERNSYAPIIYKTITFYLVENYKDSVIREFILNNFSILFESNSNIPVGILLEPLAKQFQVTGDIEYNTTDFDFFIQIAEHPRLTMKHALQIMDVLGKIFMNERFYTKCAGIPFLLISKRFIETPSIKEYLYRFVKYSLKLACQFEISGKSVGKEEEFESDEKFQRESMLEMTQKVIRVKNERLNEKVAKEICEVNAEIKRTTGENSKIMVNLLKLFGDPKELIDAYVQQYGDMKDEEIEMEAEGISKIEPISGKKLAKKGKIVSESSTTSLNSLNIMPRGRVEREIEKIRQNLLEKELGSNLNEEKLKAALDNKKRLLRKQVEKRRIDLGVGSKLELSFKSEELKPAAPTSLIELTVEEKEIIGYVLKRYQRVLKLLFKKYSSTGYKHSVLNNSTFDSISEKNSVLTDSEFYKLLKEQGVTTSMMSMEECSSIIKSYCHKLKKPQLKVNFFEFQDLIVQASLLIYSKPAKSLAHLHPVVSVKQFFEFFRKSSAEKGISTKFYDEPDPGVGDREIVKRLNVLLEKDPNTLIPEGYRKVIENDVEISYKVPAVMEIKESQKITLSVLDDILEKQFGIHILEPEIIVKSVTRARGVLSKPQIAADNEASPDLSNKFNISSTGISYHKAVYAPSLPTDLILTPGIKFEIAKFTGKYSNDLLYDCAKLVDDLLHTVDSGSFSIISRNNKTKIINKAQIIKEQNEEIKRIEEQKRERKRKLRRQIIEENMIKGKQKKEIEIKEDKEKKKAEEAKKREIKKKNEEKRKEEMEKKEKELKEWKEKKKEEMKKLKQEEMKTKAILDEEKKKKFEELQNKEKQRILKLQEDLAEKPVKGKKLDKKRQSPEEKKLQLEKVLYSENFKQEEAKKLEEKIKSIMSSPQIQETFSSFTKATELIFTHLCKSTTNKDGSAPGSLIFIAFNKFCTMFNVCPGLMQLEECLKIFRLITRNKTPQVGLAVALELQEFKEACLRIAVLCKSELEKGKNTSFKTEAEALRALFEYLNVTNDVKQVRDLLQNIETSNNKLHPRVKKQMKNELNKSVSNDFTPSGPKLRSKSSPKKREPKKIDS